LLIMLVTLPVVLKNYSPNQKLFNFRAWTY